MGKLRGPQPPGGYADERSAQRLRLREATRLACDGTVTTCRADM